MGNTTSVDSCAPSPSSFLIEHYCDPRGEMKSVEYWCPPGCVDGLCPEGGDPDSLYCIDTDFDTTNHYGVTYGHPRIGYEDQCYNSTTLIEYKCGGNYQITHYEYACPYGGCQYGECTKSTACTDSDGNNQFVKGTVTLLDGTSATDYCIFNGTGLNEMLCSYTGSISGNTYWCTCVNGACTS